MIAARGDCVAPSGRRVSIADAVARCVAATKECRPEDPVEPPGPARATLRTAVVNTTSLASARAFAARGIAPLVLSFASAKSRGGDVLGGARAQEESLARAGASCLPRRSSDVGAPSFIGRPSFGELFHAGRASLGTTRARLAPGST